MEKFHFVIVDSITAFARAERFLDGSPIIELNTSFVGPMTDEKLGEYITEYETKNDTKLIKVSDLGDLTEDDYRLVFWIQDQVLLIIGEG